MTFRRTERFDRPQEPVRQPRLATSAPTMLIAVFLAVALALVLLDLADHIHRLFNEGMVQP